ncbi:Fe2OG dioxygenase domain-containing protein [Heracleum sosnowskyi]|uniref:Fe2OG dioxygenase domain-containing protein n=1 Tax=Heracleum sosnowskyi TaxID=360622 RepID=A0AAD8I2N5_9APIA|nr:Fe2OG dioxygenase domain-containing protein [Heracleum sosnowskyi]
MTSEVKSMENSGGLGWGSSLPVPSVQELARNDSQCVPERYIQKLEDRPLHFETSQVSDEIPVINLSKLAIGDEDESRNFDFACKEWGFFQVTDHGVSDKVLHTMKAVVESFFELPLVEKKVYAMAHNDFQGYGQGYVVSDDQKLDWNDLLFLITSPLMYKNMKHWPNTLTGFREAVELYSTELQKVGDEIFAKMSVLMGMEKESLKDIHGVMKLGIRMNYYPSCAKPDLVLGVSPHSDASSLTLLLQDDETTGLQIKHRGIWVPVKPIPNALVVNIGDAMEVLSNGVYKSVEHRAVTNQKKSRISIATFFIPEDELEIGPLDTMVDEDHRPRMYKNVKYIDYLRYTLGRKMEGKNHIDILKLDNE